VDTGFRKRSCSSNNLERDDDSKKSHPALAACRRPALFKNESSLPGVISWGPFNPENEMADKSQQQSQSGSSQKQQGGNLGQKDAQRQQQAEQDLDRMGEKSDRSNDMNKQQR
jgi:hypothetical protein